MMTLTHRLNEHTSVRLGILSDTHGQLDPRIAQTISDCDVAIHAGDIGDGHILEQLSPRSGLVIAVRGNNDHPWLWSAEHHATLQQIPDEAIVELPGGSVCVSHGDRQWCRENWHLNLRNVYPQARAIIYGHSHHLSCDQEAEPWVINPGAAGHTRTHGGPSCMTLIATHDEWTLDTHRYQDEALASISA